MSALVQSASEYPVVGGVSFPLSTTAGNRVVNVASTGDSAANMDALTSPAGYSTVSAVAFAGGALKFWYKDNESSIAGLTVTNLDAKNDPGSAIFEASGTLGGAFDATAWTASVVITGTGTSIATNPFTPTAPSFILSVWADESVSQPSVSPGTNYNAAQQQLGHLDNQCYRTGAPASSQTATLTLGTNTTNTWIFGAICFAEASGGATPTLLSMALKTLGQGRPPRAFRPSQAGLKKVIGN